MRSVVVLAALLVALGLGLTGGPATAGTVKIDFPSGFNFALSGGSLYDASGPSYGATTSIPDGVVFYFDFGSGYVPVGAIPSGAFADLLITNIPPIPTTGTPVTASGGTFHFDLLTPSYGPNSGVKLTFNQAQLSYFGPTQFVLAVTGTATVFQQEMDYPFGQLWFDTPADINLSLWGTVSGAQFDNDGNLIAFSGVTSPSGNLNGPGGYVPEPASLVIWSVLGTALCVVGWRARTKV